MNLLLIEDHADIAANITEFFEGAAMRSSTSSTAPRACSALSPIRTTPSSWTCCCRDWMA